jgi:carboxylate-amine ligase
LEVKSSRPYSVGVEIELQLVDAGTLDLVDGILPLMEFFPGSPYVKPEFIQNTVEISSRVCDGPSELASHLADLIRGVSLRCGELGMRLCGAGSHPFCERLAVITPLPRYLRLEQSGGYLGHTQIVFALHVHIGLRSGAEIVRAMRLIRPYLPLVIALSANSPFWRGYDTGFASYRHRILAATRSYGIPPSFDTWNDFVRFFHTVRAAGIFDGLRDIHWDVRPRPDLGTVEVRAMDSQYSVTRTVALAIFVRALIRYLLEFTESVPAPGGPLRPLPWWTEKENHFQASRAGLSAPYIHNADGDSRPLLDVTREVLAAIRTAGPVPEEGQWLDTVEVMAEQGAGYGHQLQVFEKTGSLRKVVADLTQALDDDVNVRCSAKAGHSGR